ncbi:MAG: hypothetical protein WCC84_17690 [Candidatus Cybelea sp.]
MGSFDQFDLVAYLVPGALILISYALLWPLTEDLPYGDATIAVAVAIISYALGHICAAISRAARGGCRNLPGQKQRSRKSDDEWLKAGLDDDQWPRFAELIQTRLSRTLTDTTRLNSGWPKLGRQIYADIAAHGRAKRLDAYRRAQSFYGTLQVAVVIIGVMIATKASQSNNYYFLLLWLPITIVILARDWQTREYNT